MFEIHCPTTMGDVPYRQFAALCESYIQQNLTSNGLRKVFRLIESQIISKFDEMSALLDRMFAMQNAPPSEPTEVLVEVDVDDHDEDESGHVWIPVNESTNVRKLFTDAIMEVIIQDTGCALKVDEQKRTVIIKGAAHLRAARKLANIERNSHRAKVVSHVLQTEKVVDAFVQLPVLLGQPNNMLLRTLVTPSPEYLADVLPGMRTCRMVYYNSSTRKYEIISTAAKGSGPAPLVLRQTWMELSFPARGATAVESGREAPSSSTGIPDITLEPPRRRARKSRFDIPPPGIEIKAEEEDEKAEKEDEAPVATRPRKSRFDIPPPSIVVQPDKGQDMTVAKRSRKSRFDMQLLDGLEQPPSKEDPPRLERPQEVPDLMTPQEPALLTLPKEHWSANFQASANSPAHQKKEDIMKWASTVPAVSLNEPSSLDRQTHDPTTRTANSTATRATGQLLSEETSGGMSGLDRSYNASPSASTVGGSTVTGLRRPCTPAIPVSHTPSRTNTPTTMCQTPSAPGSQDYTLEGPPTRRYLRSLPNGHSTRSSARNVALRYEQTSFSSGHAWENKIVTAQPLTAASDIVDVTEPEWEGPKDANPFPPLGFKGKLLPKVRPGLFPASTTSFPPILPQQYDDSRPYKRKGKKQKEVQPPLSVATDRQQNVNHDRLIDLDGTIGSITSPILLPSSAGTVVRCGKNEANEPSLSRSSEDLHSTDGIHLIDFDDELGSISAPSPFHVSSGTSPCTKGFRHDLLEMEDDVPRSFSDTELLLPVPSKSLGRAENAELQEDNATASNVKAIRHSSKSNREEALITFEDLEPQPITSDHLSNTMPALTPQQAVPTLAHTLSNDGRSFLQTAFPMFQAHPALGTTIPEMDDDIPERLQAVSEVETRRFHRTMAQKKGKRKGKSKIDTSGLPRPDPSPPPRPTSTNSKKNGSSATTTQSLSVNTELVKSKGDDSHNTDDMLLVLEHARSFKGSLDIEVQIGQALVHSVKSGEPSNFAKHLLRKEVLEKELAVHQASGGLEVHFSRMLTTDVSEACHIAVPHLFKEEPSQFETFYEFVLLDKDNKEVHLTISPVSAQDADIFLPTEELGMVYLHFPKRIWDARYVVNGRKNYQASEAIHKFIATIKVEVPIHELAGEKFPVPRIKYRVESNEISVQAVYVKRCLRHQSIKPSKIVLQVTDIRLLELAQRKQDPVAKAALSGFPSVMVEEHRLWFEASLLVPQSPLLEQNRTIQIGDDAEWTPEEVLPPDALAHLRAVTEQLITRIDGVGLSNRGPRGDVQDLLNIEARAKAKAEEKSGLHQPYW